MAKFKKTVIGSVLKSQNGGLDYVKIRPTVRGEDGKVVVLEDITLKSGTTLSLENKASKIQSAKKALEEGKLSEETVEKIIAQAEQMPDFVRFEIVLLEKNAD